MIAPQTATKEAYGVAALQPYKNTISFPSRCVDTADPIAIVGMGTLPADNPWVLKLTKQPAAGLATHKVATMSNHPKLYGSSW